MDWAVILKSTLECNSILALALGLMTFGVKFLDALVNLSLEFGWEVVGDDDWRVWAETVIGYPLPNGYVRCEMYREIALNLGADHKHPYRGLGIGVGARVQVDLLRGQFVQSEDIG